jgi:hypothetical protein
MVKIRYFPLSRGRGVAKGRGEVFFDVIDLIPLPLLPRGEGGIAIATIE